MNHPPLEDISRLHASLCRALADPKRILIIYALYEQPRHVTGLAKDLNLPQPTVSRHLRILRQHSLVITERDGASVYYYLADRRIIDVLDTMQQVMIDSLAHRSNVLETAAITN